MRGNAKAEWDMGHIEEEMRRWVYSTNAKDIGTLYIIFALIAGLIGILVYIILTIGKDGYTLIRRERMEPIDIGGISLMLMLMIILSRSGTRYLHTRNVGKAFYGGKGQNDRSIGGRLKDWAKVIRGWREDGELLLPEWWIDLKVRYGLNIKIRYALLGSAICRQLLRGMMYGGYYFSENRFIMIGIVSMTIYVMIVNLFMTLEFVIYIFYQIYGLGRRGWVMVTGQLGGRGGAAVSETVVKAGLRHVQSMPNLGGSGGGGGGSSFMNRVGPHIMRFLGGGAGAAGATLAGGEIYGSVRGYGDVSESPLRYKLALGGMRMGYYRSMPNLKEVMESPEGQRMIERVNDRSRAMLEMDLQLRREMREEASRLSARGERAEAAILNATSRGYGPDK